VHKENSKLRETFGDFAVKNKTAIYAKNYAKNAKGIVLFGKTVVPLARKSTSKNQILLLRCAAPCVSSFNNYYNYYAAMQLFRCIAPQIFVVK
jgi:hypothetical protein